MDCDCGNSAHFGTDSCLEHNCYKYNFSDLLKMTGKHGPGSQIKISVGRTIFNINSEILELSEEYRRVKPGENLSKRGLELEKSIKKKKEGLEEALAGLESKQAMIVSEKLEKTVKMIRDNIETAKKVLEGVKDGTAVAESEVNDAKKEASEVIKEAEDDAKKLEQDVAGIMGSLPSASTLDDKESSDVDDELARIGEYQAKRVKKMKNLINEKMSDHKDELVTRWNTQKELLDYQSLKEIRSEFESTHKKMRHMVNKWDKRRMSDVLTDHLVDSIDHEYDEYMKHFKVMEETKRTEAAVLRKRNAELEEYKREKRRAIPSWPKSLPYTKFKQDLLSWDKEHYLSSGSVKFGLLGEMLKNQDRITTYEQIQTRLGKSRNDANIVKQVVELLDQINEETVYNKLCTAWKSLNELKKSKEESLNDFFSKYETLTYSLNLADDTYEELEPVVAGKDLKYYEDREKMLLRKVELNDKIKAVNLIKALDLDGAHERDILAKVDFNKEPRTVYEETKVAIRDIVGDKQHEKEDVVHVVKPWQEKSYRDHGRQNHYYSRSRSGDGRGRYPSRDRSREDSRGRKQNMSRDRSFSRERSSSRGRDRQRHAVSFQDKKVRRDPTPGAGTNSVIMCNKSYDRIYKTDKFFTSKDSGKGQFIIVDSGCPRALMGEDEYIKLKSQFKVTKETEVYEKFKFGPSKIYKSKIRTQMILKIGVHFQEISFFVVEGSNIPILLGNDVMEPLEANINMKTHEIEFLKLGESLPMIKTKGWAFCDICD